MSEKYAKLLAELITASGVDEDLLETSGFLDEYLESAISLSAEEASSRQAFRDEAKPRTALVDKALASIKRAEGKPAIEQEIERVRELQNVLREHKERHPED